MRWYTYGNACTRIVYHTRSQLPNEIIVLHQNFTNAATTAVNFIHVEYMDSYN